ncbi:MAG: Oxidored q6 protein [Candidatus Berkelbacteria bacterium]|nr:Oxidored q6 protein [Candidatus Berkelbacteria bacterium]
MNLPDYVTKIEGHGVLNIHFKECHARLEVTEGERLFEAVLLGQNATRAPFITSRICGVCPTAHNLASIAAVENALNIEPDKLTLELRKLMLAGQVIFSHLLHLFFLVLPDYYNVPSALALADKFPAEYHLALNLKRLSDHLLTVVGGRPIHPTTTTVGGFIQYPAKGDLVTLQNEIADVLDEAQDFVKIFMSIEYPEYRRGSEYLSLKNDEYDLLGDIVISSSGGQFSPKDYKNEIKETIKDYSTAKFGTHKEKPFNVGAIARVGLFYDKLNPKAKGLAGDFRPNSQSHNAFENVKAQAIELMHFLEEADKSIVNLLNVEIPEKPAAISLPKLSQNTWGIGAVEAPRGTLYHAYEIGPNDKIINADIVTPTVQNLTSVEADAEALLHSLKLDLKTQNICVIELEKLIRAYDPCITCSVH